MLAKKILSAKLFIVAASNYYISVLGILSSYGNNAEMLYRICSLVVVLLMVVSNVSKITWNVQLVTMLDCILNTRTQVSIAAVLYCIVYTCTVLLQSSLLAATL